MGWGLVKVATFNINNINKRLDNLLAWLAKAEPDVVSLQELKAEQEAFPAGRNHVAEDEPRTNTYRVYLRRSGPRFPQLSGVFPWYLFWTGLLHTV
jgi:exodeoxyribonuclease III